ncbi:MAG TPA: NADH-quinone oxidoreductase subunit NuoG, partial [bacterium]|nr:NADH-quinone oxidoreductase subunit NuoG [bacterium]
TPVEDGLRISLKDPDAKQFRQNIIEWLMVNHPHDCPVCDEGGECHLQDMTVMTGHSYREFRFKKRTHRNQDLGPFINHEMNRCITCYRCVRFYRDYAGGDDLHAFAAHDHVYFGRHKDGKLRSPFSGNLVEVCPTGVFTDKTLKQHYTRKWDLQTAPSICQQCGLGCNIIPGERYGTLRRILNRYNRQVNGYFLCDRGRFGYEFVNRDDRIKHPIVSGKTTTANEAVSRIGALVRDKNKVIGIGSPRASLESNYALRTMVGSNRFYSGMSTKESELVRFAQKVLHRGPARSASLHDVEQADAVVILGEDLTNTAPMLDLAVRQAVRNQPIKAASEFGIPEWHDAAVREMAQDEKGPLFIATPVGTELDKFATETYRLAPDDIARLGFAIASALDEEAPVLSDISDEMKERAETIAQILREANHPVVISGTSLLEPSVIQAAANVAWALSAEGNPAGISLTVPEANSMGVTYLEGRSLDGAMRAIAEGDADTVVIVENDLYRRAAPAAVDEFLNKCKQVICIDHLENATTQHADILLPAGTFAEADGTLINNEGRAQRFYQVYTEDESEVQESWRWVRDILEVNEDVDVSGWNGLDDVFSAMLKSVEQFAALADLAPDSNYRIHRQKIPRESFRYSGRTAMKADKNVHEQNPPDDPDSPLSFSMEGYSGKQPPGLTSFFWAPGWNSVQATNKYQSEVGGELRGGDPGIRLIEPTTKEADYYREIPGSFTAASEKYYTVPLYHIFGSEELSARSEGVAKEVPEPYLAVSPGDAQSLNIESDNEVTLELGGAQQTLRVQVTGELPAGIIGVPRGLPGLSAPDLPGWAKVTGVTES